MRKIIPKSKQPLIYVRWQDAHSSSGWMTEKQLEDNVNDEICVCEEIGWLVYEDKKEIHMVSRRINWNKTDAEKDLEYGLYQRIPKAWIFEKKRVVVK